MMHPISRMPLEDMTEMQIINIEAVGEYSIPEAMAILLEHSQNSTDLSFTLDWAMQLRDRTGQDWGTCIRVAMIAFYG